MRVVCDNCGAVYKISEAKLVKDVNRATCKRCGHKILISKPGASSAAEVATGFQHGASEQDQIVVKSSPDLPSAPSPMVPSIGSLTAELRAITIPGMDSVGGGAAGNAARIGPATDESDSELTERRDLGAPVVAPSTAIPASNSPATMAYRGPGPAVSSGAPTVDSAGPSAPTNGASTAPVVSAGVVSARNTSLGTAAGVTRPSSAALTRPSASSGAAATVLSSVALCSGLGLLGMVASVFLTGPAALVAGGLAGFGLCGSLALGVLTGGGTNPGRVSLAFLLGGVGGVAVAALGMIQPPAPISSTTTETSPAAAESIDARAAAEVDEGEGSDALAASQDPTVAGPPEQAGLTAEELEEARRFELGQSADAEKLEESEPVAAATKASKADMDVEAEARREAAEQRREETRRADAERRAEKRRQDEAARKEEAASRKAEREAEAERKASLGGPKRASLKKPDAGKPEASKSSGPKPFVIDTIIRNNGNIKRCLEAERGRGQDLSGKIFLQFTISPDGGVSRAKLTTSRWAGTSLDSCISKQVNRLEFPPFEGGAKKIKYALVIQ